MSYTSSSQKEKHAVISKTGNSSVIMRFKHDSFLNKADQEIWLEFKSGNEDAFIFIYDTYFESLVTYGLNFCTDRDLVLDCLQDMFIDLREKRKSITKTDDIKPMLFKIFRRRINHYLTRLNRDANRKNAAAQMEFGITFSYEHQLIEKQLTQGQIEAINRAIQKITSKEREVIYQYYYENMAYCQIADVMGYTQVKTARTLVYRALKSIKNAIESGR